MIDPVAPSRLALSSYFVPESHIARRNDAQKESIETEERQVPEEVVPPNSLAHFDGIIIDLCIMVDTELAQGALGK